MKACSIYLEQAFFNAADITQVREINGHELKFTNLNKIYWPEDKITKSLNPCLVKESIW